MDIKNSYDAIEEGLFLYLTPIFSYTIMRIAICILAFLLPQTAFASEKVSYKIDSSGKGKEITIPSAQSSVSNKGLKVSKVEFDEMIRENLTKEY